MEFRAVLRMMINSVERRLAWLSSVRFPNFVSD